MEQHIMPCMSTVICKSPQFSLRVYLGPHEFRSGDYELSVKVDMQKSFQKMYAEEGTTEEASDGVKYGPNKFDLVEEWAESSAFDWEACAQHDDARVLKKKTQKKNKKLSWNAREARLYHVFRGVARRLHKKDLQVWIHACGRFVCQKLGPLIFLKKHNIIFKVKEGKGKNIPKCDILDVHLAGGQGKWALCPLKKKVPQPIEASMKLSDELNAMRVKKVPRTVDQVETLLKAFSKKALGRKKKARCGQKKKAGRRRPGDGPGYVKLWFFRGRVTRMLHRARCTLQVKKATVAKLGRLFPDTGGWVRKFCRVLGLNPQKTYAELDISRNEPYTPNPKPPSLQACVLMLSILIGCA